MITLRLFAQARQAAGTGRCEFEFGSDGQTVQDIVDEAAQKFGEPFDQVVDVCKIWVNGDQAERADALRDGDEVAILPPVSGG